MVEMRDDEGIACFLQHCHEAEAICSAGDADEERTVGANAAAFAQNQVEVPEHEGIRR